MLPELATVLICTIFMVLVFVPLAGYAEGMDIGAPCFKQLEVGQIGIKLGRDSFGCNDLFKL